MSPEAKKVLIVDDEAEMLEFVQVALEDDGYDLRVAEDGKVALQKTREDRPDLIILDIQMPNKDGLSTLYDLRHDPATRAIPVLLLTGAAEKTGVRFSAAAVEEYMGERPELFLDKPVDPGELRQAVRSLLSQ